MNKIFEFEPDIPDRECDFKIEWEDDRGLHIWIVYVDEKALVSERNLEDGGGMAAWSFKLVDNEKMFAVQNNRYGNWEEASDHPMNCLMRLELLNYIVEKELLDE